MPLRDSDGSYGGLEKRDGPGQKTEQKRTEGLDMQGWKAETQVINITNSRKPK